MSLAAFFRKQFLMRKVVYSLIPIILSAIYLFGWRVLFLLLVITLAGILTEYIFTRNRKQPVSEAIFVSCILYTLTLPPTIPYWIAIIGIIFGIIFGKELFGGFGKNIYNPALVGRSFIYVSFAQPMTLHWQLPTQGFTQWLTNIDHITSATPMIEFQSSGHLTPYLNLLIGNVSGSIGETSAILILIAAIYLIKTKTASWQIMGSVVLGFVSLNSILYLLNFPSIPPTVWGLLSGGILFGAVFMATDPISAPSTKAAKWIYGFLIGFIVVIIRGFSLFSGGTMFAILIGNTFAPLLDQMIIRLKKKKVAV